MRVLDLFSGIGGISIGLERAGMTTAAFCEIEPFCRAVLAKHWPNTRIYDDVRTLDGNEWRGSIDVVAGGFPCQDVSLAGKGKGIAEGTRSGLWFEMRRIIGEVRPRWVLAENVFALRHRGGDGVLADLEGLGYSCWPVVVGAVHAGAPHRRQRVWIVGRLVNADHDDWRRLSSTQQSTRRRGTPLAGETGLADAIDAAGAPQLVSGRAGCEAAEPARPGERSVEHPGGAGREERDLARIAGGTRHAAGRHHAWPSRPGEPQHGWEEPRLTQCEVGRATDGLPTGLVRLAKRHNREALRAYGNSVVPQVVEMIGRWIMQQERP